MDLKWQDAEDIAIRLVEEHPDADPLTIRFTDMHAWIVALPDFKDDPKKSNEKILESRLPANDVNILWCYSVTGEGEALS
ncbi:MAG: Fe-S assembly protein IscX [Nitrospira sp. NTP1]|nr:Fe-S assembly protein IscX [Nitrospira sp. NTP1]